MSSPDDHSLEYNALDLIQEYLLSKGFALDENSEMIKMGLDFLMRTFDGPHNSKISAMNHTKGELHIDYVRTIKIKLTDPNSLDILDEFLEGVNAFA